MLHEDKGVGTGFEWVGYIQVEMGTRVTQKMELLPEQGQGAEALWECGVVPQGTDGHT